MSKKLIKEAVKTTRNQGRGSDSERQREAGGKLGRGWVGSPARGAAAAATARPVSPQVDRRSRPYLLTCLSAGTHTGTHASPYTHF